MQADTSSAGRTARTFTEQARRTQIIAAAIETIAEVGYPNTTFAKIAKRAGLSSTGVISYHFNGKDDLVRAAAGEALRVSGDYLRERMATASGYAATLRVRIQANIALLASHPRHLRALVEIFANAKTSSGAPVVEPALLDARAGLFETHLRDGQRAGEFGTFDPRVTAIAILGAIDATIGAYATAPDPAAIDLDHLGTELADTFERATRP